MFSGSGRIWLAGASYAALFCLIFHSCMARDCASSCGNIRNISHPFRLKTDPKHCGIKFFELVCVDDTLILYVNVSGGRQVGYRVQAINYNNFTIRLTDPNVFMDDCTLHSLNTYEGSINDLPMFQYQFHSDAFSEYNYGYENRCQKMILWSCPFPFSGKVDGFNSSCNEVAVTKRYWYANVGDIKAYDLKNSCRMEYKTWTSLLPEGANNISYKDVNNSLAYGFEPITSPTKT